MSSYIAIELRKQVREDAGGRCGYCQSSEKVSGLGLQFEHLCPESAGGRSSRENLWMACSRCNAFKHDRQTGVDPETRESVKLFNPRAQIWNEHFVWRDRGVRLHGLTPEGRATVATLQMNDPLIVAARMLWVQWKVHPPD